MDWVVDARRLSLLCAPRDSLRINPGLFPVIASDMALGGPRVCGDGDRSWIGLSIAAVRGRMEGDLVDVGKICGERPFSTTRSWFIKERLERRVGM